MKKIFGTSCNPFSRRDKEGKISHSIDCSDAIIVSINGKVISGNDSTPLDLLELLSMTGMRRQQPEDLFFNDEELIKPINKSCNEFLTNLNYSNRSTQFVHGTTMLPGMLKGFTDFLENKGLFLETINKIKFKKPTMGDLKYIISEEKSPELSEKANIIGEFTDNNDKKYNFYAIQKKWERRPSIYNNDIPGVIITNRSYEWQNEITEKNEFPLYDQTMSNIQPYVDKMEENEGFVWAVVLDMINMIYQVKLRRSGVVMNYEDLTIDKESFNPEELFDGSCILQTDIIGEPRSLGDGKGYRTSFSIINKEKEKIIEGKATLLARGETFH